MATKKRTASGSTRGAKGRGKTATTGGRGSTGKGASSGGMFSRGIPVEVFGVVLIAIGLFLTAAFVTSSGAFLGDAGRYVFTGLFGVMGLVLAPVLIVVGILLIVRKFHWRRGVGGALIFLGLATAAASRLPVEFRYVREAYSGAGGIVGSGIYGGIYLIAGTIGVVIVLALVFVFGASLLSGVTLRQGYGKLQDGYAAAGEILEDRKQDIAERREERNREREAELAERSESEDSEIESGDGSDTSSENTGKSPKSSRNPRNSRARKSAKTASTSRQPQDVDELYAELEDGLVISGAVAPKSDVSNPEEPSDVVSKEEESEDEFELIVPRQSGSGGSKAAVLRTSMSGEYTPPPFTILSRGTTTPEHDAGETSKRLTQALADLGVEAKVLRAVVGPRVTRYELSLGSGVKVGKVANLQQDIAYALAATEVRILAPIPGKSAVGVEVPNLRPAKVTLGDVFDEYPESNDWALPVGLGKDISGRAVFMNLAEMPHLLVAGTTGSGKSVMLNGLLTSLLLATDPRQVKLVLIDPKRVEMAPFARVPHLITPVVTDVKKAANALSWAVSEMERRYEVLEKAGVRSLDGYNAKAETSMPYVVIVIDELADLMMTAAAKVEDAVIRIAQKARAVGIHLVVATQRPSVDVITGMIKANVPSRIAFAVSSQVDSRVILDTPGAEALLGMGDMLFKPVSASRPSRVQGAFISEAEVEKVVDATVAASKGNVEAEFIEEVVEPKIEAEASSEPEDDLIPEAANFVVATQQASVSAVQRRFRVGYSRAGRIIDALERKGIVGPYEGSKSRSVVATEADLASIFNWGGGTAAVESSDEDR